jgi:aryl-alcohol dehydrogenase-like predicted oxidoreductase
MKIIRTDCLVIGAGLAGSAYALHAARAGLSVELLSLAEPLVANSDWAQGGIIYDTTPDPASLAREIDDSLRRLNVETIDLYQIHWPAFPPGAPEQSIEAAIAALEQARRAGKIRQIGVSNFDAAQMARAQSVAPIAALQPPYSLLMRGIEASILPYTAAHGIGNIVYSPLQSGLLSGRMTRERIASLPANDWRAQRSPEFQEPNLTHNLALVEVLRGVGARHGRTPAEVAIAWTLRNPVVTGAIVGVRRPDQLDGLLGAADLKLTDADLAEIQAALPETTASPVPQSLLNA